MMQQMQCCKDTAYLILSLMRFILRIYFEDVQACLTIQRAVQIIVVTPESDKNIGLLHEKEEEAEEEEGEGEG